MQRAFVRHVGMLLSGKLMAQALSLALVPVVARLFDPADFGVASLFITISTLLGMAGHLRYFRASLLTADDTVARAVSALSVKCLATSCVVALTVVAIMQAVATTTGFRNPLGAWVWLLPVGMFLYGMAEVMATIHVRAQTFRALAVADVAETLLVGGSRILMGLGGSSVWGLVVGYVIGSTGRITLLARNAITPFALLSEPMSWSTSKKLMTEYRDFPLLSLPAGLITVLAAKIPFFVLGILYEPSVLGFYAMADRVIQTPVIAAGTSIREVFMRKLGHNVQAGASLRGSLTKLTLAMFVLGLLPFGLLGVWGAEILTVILGDRWADVGLYVQILAPWYYASWVATGVQPTMVALRAQGLWLRIQLGMLLARLLVFAVGYVAGADVQVILEWFAGVNVVIAGLGLVLAFYLLRLPSSRSA